jgi:hypothetical protein
MDATFTTPTQGIETMNLVRRVVEILVERFVGSVGSLFAARIETVATLMHTEQQDELEERARQLDDEGKTHLAADLRSRASQLASATPGATGHDIFRRLTHEHAEFDPPRITQADTEPSNNTDDDEQSAESAAPRPARRRSRRRTKSADSNETPKS